MQMLFLKKDITVLYSTPSLIRRLPRRNFCKGFYSLFLKIFIALLFYTSTSAQTFIITGTVLDSASGIPLHNVTVHLMNTNTTVLSHDDGSFSLSSDAWQDSLEITSIGFQRMVVPLQKHHTEDVVIKMIPAAQDLQAVVIMGAERDKEPGRRYMRKVIANKMFNNPDRFKNYSYKQYLRHEVDINNIDSTTNGKGLKSFVLKTYHNAEEQNAGSRLLPVFFSETDSEK